jgi:nicotinic acid mononucleotide adenylyltransferase
VVEAAEADAPVPDRVALVPGSYDPMTIAHAALAAAASAWADVVVMLYSVRTVAKADGVEAPLLAEADRIRSLEAFCGSRPDTVPGLCSHGLLVDHVRAARDRYPRAELGLVIGSDKLLQLLDPIWYDDREAVLDELLGHASVMFAVREGEAADVAEALADPANRPWRHRVAPVDISPAVAAVSSSRVRSLLRTRQDVRPLVPPEVLPFLPTLANGVGWE